MNPEVEQLLLAKVMADQQTPVSPETASTIGGVLGGASGFVGTKGPLRRMAGGLVGASVGGQLGPMMQQAAMQESVAAPVLAKIQSGQELDEADKLAVQSVLREVYRDLGKE